MAAPPIGANLPAFHSNAASVPWNPDFRQGCHLNYAPSLELTANSLAKTAATRHPAGCGKESRHPRKAHLGAVLKGYSETQ